MSSKQRQFLVWGGLVAVETFPIDHPLDVRLGDHIRLLGYGLSSGSLAAGDMLTVTLFWQSDGQLVEDYHVSSHLQSADGSMVAQPDGVPVLGRRPAWSWQEGEVLQDAHALVTEAERPAGLHTLSVRMYRYPSCVRLPVIGPDGVRLSEDRIVLQEVPLVTPWTFQAHSS
jgi:hypothetical protein